MYPVAMCVCVWTQKSLPRAVGLAAPARSKATSGGSRTGISTIYKAISPYCHDCVAW